MQTPGWVSWDSCSFVSPFPVAALGSFLLTHQSSPEGYALIQHREGGGYAQRLAEQLQLAFNLENVYCNNTPRCFFKGV
jgi:hypothetical protein